MDLKKKCDVLIIGAGPAGASLAYYLAREGIDTILIDKKKDAGSPVRCAEYVPSALGRLYDIPIQGIELSTVAMTTFIDYREAGTIKAPGFMLDRKRFSTWLIDSYMAEGGIFYSSARAVSLSGDNDCVHTAVIYRGSSHTITSRFLAGADGPGSLAGKYMGSINEAYVLGLNENIPAEARAKERTMVFFSPGIPGGYGWLFPRKKSINLGIGCQAPYGSAAGSLRLKEIYGGFRDKIQSMDLIMPGDPGRRLPTGNIKAGLIPSSGMLEDPVKGRFVLAGDAAGLTNAVTGAGIYNAVLSAHIIARILGRALKEDDPGILREVKDEYRDTFGISLLRAAVKRKELLSGWTGNAGAAKDFDRLVKKTWVGFRDYWKKDCP